MTGHYYKFFALFLGLISKFFASPTVLFLSPTVLFTIKSDRSFLDSLRFFFASKFTIIKVPGFSSKSDGTFHNTGQVPGFSSKSLRVRYFSVHFSTI